MIAAADLSRMLAARIETLARDLLPDGHREGAEWRCGSVSGEPGGSLGVHLVGAKAGVWADFATGQRGDAVDLVRAVLHLDMAGALDWSRRWLRIETRPVLPTAASPTLATDLRGDGDPERWRRPWGAARPIGGTLAERYLSARRLRLDDSAGRVLRYLPQRWRQRPDTGILESHPALLALLCDVRSGAAVGVINIFLRADGADRLRDRKGKTVTGRARLAAIMLSSFDDPTIGLVICEGVETGIALRQAELAPVWALGGAGHLSAFPVLSGIEALTIAADADRPGRRAAVCCAARWRQAGREVVTIAPPAGDWADPRRAA
jgi:hypothetical protein